MNSINKDANHSYRVFSEIITTDFKVPFLKPFITDKETFSITKSKKIKNCENKDYFLLNSEEAKFCKKDQVKVNIKENLTYQVLNKEICDSDLSFKLLTHPMGLFFFKKDNYVLHSSAININNKAFIFMGLSGSGKSSLIASLLNFGEMITEDISKIKFIDNSAFVYPSIPVIKLSKDILDHHKFGITNEFDLAGDRRNRKGYVVKNFDKTNAPVRVHGCFILNDSNSKKIEKVNSNFALRNLVMNSFGPIPKNKCLTSENMLLQNISRFIDSVPVYNLPRQKKYSNKVILDFISKC